MALRDGRAARARRGARRSSLIEDAAHAIGTRYRGRAAGTLGDAASFSFYANKNITTCEGGMVTTARDEWAATIRIARLHGVDVDASRRDGHEYRHWEAVALGWKYNLNDLQAAIGVAQLAKLAGRPAAAPRARRALPRRPSRRSKRSRRSKVRRVARRRRTSSRCCCDLERIRIDRDTVLRALLAENIGVGVHYRALPLHKFFRERLGQPPEAVPVATDASHRTLTLPLFAGLSDAEQDQTLTALSRILRFYAR